MRRSTGYSLDRQPLPAGQTDTQRWLTLPGGRRVLLVRQQRWIGRWRRWRSMLSRKPLISQTQRQATLLWRLERHGVTRRPARHWPPGQRQQGGQVDSFLLSEPARHRGHPAGERWLSGPNPPPAAASGDLVPGGRAAGADARGLLLSRGVPCPRQPSGSTRRRGSRRWSWRTSRRSRCGVGPVRRGRDATWRPSSPASLPGRAIQPKDGAASKRGTPRCRAKSRPRPGPNLALRHRSRPLR